jgi:hypothetical protein
MDFLLCGFILELLHYYKNNHYEMEYQDCYGIFIKIQDLIENFAESLTILVSGVFVLDVLTLFLLVKSSKID